MMLWWKLRRQSWWQQSGPQWPISDITRAWKPALDQVWAFLKTNGELGPGHNLFLYHHAERRNEAMNIDFGVQVARPFERAGDVRCIETPTGEVARTVHVGPYDRLGDAHNATASVGTAASIRSAAR
jgi:hypothetical protein